MSGTSLDGLDIAYCHFFKINGAWEFDLIKSLNIPYSKDWKERLREAVHLPSIDLLELNVRYGTWLGKQVKNFIDTHKLDVDFISSHGHTVFHQPEKGFTYQIGDGQRIAVESSHKVVCDFRKKDVAFGGQGAPLVPIGDELLFGKYSACLNLGGIANVSLKKNKDRLAYDIGLANMPINYLVNQIGMDFDNEGALARLGNVDKVLLSNLNELPYYRLPYPKSVGYEWFLEKVVPVLENCNLTLNDKLATIVEHIAIQIGNALKSNKIGKGEILITGGGALNNYLIERIALYLPRSLSITIPEKHLIDYKEAIVFALMGVLKLNNETNIFSSVTGASTDVSGGEWFDPQ